MGDKGPVWDDIVRKHKLRPYRLRDLVPSWEYADFTFRYRQAPFESLLSTIKIRQAGFLECIDTTEMFVTRLRNLQNDRILPTLAGSERYHQLRAKAWAEREGISSWQRNHYSENSRPAGDEKEVVRPDQRRNSRDGGRTNLDQEHHTVMFGCGLAIAERESDCSRHQNPSTRVRVGRIAHRLSLKRSTLLPHCDGTSHHSQI